MNTDTRPLAALFGFKSEEGHLVFLGRNGEIVIEDFVDELLQILRHCNGLNSLEQVKSKGPPIEGVVFNSLIKTCFEYGILQDSASLLYRFHEDSANPMQFFHDLSPGDINNLVERPRREPQLHALSPEVRLSTNLLGLLRSRKSIRSFSRRAIHETLVFGFLEAMYTVGKARSTPSAGLLYPLEIFLAFTEGEQDFEPGIYRYDAQRLALERTGLVVTPEKVARALSLPSVPGGFVVFVTADLSVVSAKYANRGYRYALIEAGHASQNAYLFAAESGLGLVEYGGFDDRVSANLLSLEYPQQAVLTTLIVGYESHDGNIIDQEAGSTLWWLRNELAGEGKPVAWVTRTTLGRDEYTLDKVLAVASYNLDGIAPSKGGLIPHCYGLSTDGRVACIKALAEAFERYASGQLRWDVVSTADAIDGLWLDPRLFTPFEEGQYSLLSDLGPFDPSEPYQWVKGRRHSSGEPVLVPVEHVFYPVLASVIGRKPCYSASSSGVAAHFNYSEAVRRALLELIERDAIMATWYGLRDVHTLPDETLSSSVRHRKEKWEKLGWKVKLLNITTDSVPVVLALIVSDALYPYASSGASAAESYDVATSRALEEAELMLVSWRFADPRPPLQPEQVVSTLDHGLIYFQRENLHYLDWLRKATPQHPGPTFAGNILKMFDPVIVDIVKAVGNSQLNVVRVISEILLPINFGYGCEHYRHPRLAMLGLEWRREFPSFPHLFA